MCVSKSVPGTLGGWHGWILAGYFGDWNISVLWTGNVLILDLHQQSAWENKLCLIVVFLGAEESSCCGGGAELSHSTWEYLNFSSSVCSENNWPGFCVFGLNQPCALPDKKIHHPLYAPIRVKLLEEWASNEYDGEGGIDSPFFGFDFGNVSHQTDFEGLHVSQFVVWIYI